jgi:hypothetical protein
MAVKKSVFASRPERANYYKLSRQWGEKYRIWHNLPFLNVIEGKTYFDWESIEERRVTDIEFNLLKKTSIDYVLCDEKDAPILGIEFDGMNDGYNVGTRYVAEPPPDTVRVRMLELKLRIAHGSLFPYFVLGSKYFAELGRDVRLTIVDGIIGAVLSSLATKARFAEGFRPSDIGMSDDEFAELPDHAQWELVENWALGVEVDNDCEFNPIIKKRFELEMRLGGILRARSQFLHSVDLPSDASVQQRSALFRMEHQHGTRVTIEGDRFGSVTCDLWIANFQSPYFGGIGMAEEIATVMALEEASKRIANSMTLEEAIRGLVERVANGSASDVI